MLTWWKKIFECFVTVLTPGIDDSAFKSRHTDGLCVSAPTLSTTEDEVMQSQKTFFSPVYMVSCSQISLAYCKHRCLLFLILGGFDGIRARTPLQHQQQAHSQWTKLPPPHYRPLDHAQGLMVIQPLLKCRYSFVSCNVSHTVVCVENALITM